MTPIILSILTLAFAVLTWRFLSLLPTRLWFIHPFVPCSTYFIVLPLLRGWLDYSGYLDRPDVDPVFATYVQLYGFMFWLLFYAVSYVMTFRAPRVEPIVHEAYVVGVDRLWHASIWFGIGILAVLIVGGSATGVFQTLGDNRYVARGPIVAVVKLLVEVRWLLFGMALVAYFVRPTAANLLPCLALWALFLFLGVVTGARGSVLMVLVTALPILLIRKLSAPALLGAGGACVLALCVIIAISVARSENVFQKTQTTASATEEVRDGWQDSFDQLDEQVQSLLARSTIYTVDFQTLMSIKDMGREPTEYRWGSLRDLLQFVPRVLWPGKPYLSFNVFNSRYLYNRRFQNEYDCPIGRAAESFYLMSWGGIVIGMFYGWAYTLLYLRLFSENRSALMRALYVFILFAYIIVGAASMTNRLAVLAQTAVLLSPLLYLLYRREQRMLQGLRR